MVVMNIEGFPASDVPTSAFNIGMLPDVDLMLWTSLAVEAVNEEHTHRLGSGITTAVARC